MMVDFVELAESSVKENRAEAAEGSQRQAPENFQTAGTNPKRIGCKTSFKKNRVRHSSQRFSRFPAAQILMRDDFSPQPRCTGVLSVSIPTRAGLVF
jgi:hypothetical protein